MLIDTDTRIDTLVRAINDVLIDLGPAGLTLRRIADYSGVSTSSMLHQLRSREHLLRVVAARTARGRLEALRSESGFDGVLAFLPRSGEELLDTRAWLAWLELWRSEDYLGRWIADSRDEERGLLAQLTEYEWRRPELDELLALIDGLRVAVCAPIRPMRLEVAREILAARCHSLPSPRVHLSPER
jgi:AcrR family transcriptional regulator